MRTIASRARALFSGAVLAFGTAAGGADLVPLPGHVLPALAESTEVVARTKSLAANDEPVTLTVVLRRENEVAFQSFLAELYDPKSPTFRKYLTPIEISDRYGPSQESYDALKAYFESQGFVLSEGSANRMTLTLRGTRAMAEAALSTRIADYRIGDKTFRANAEAPKLPADLAWRVQAVVGLSDLAQPTSNGQIVYKLFCLTVRGLFGIGATAADADALMTKYLSDCVNAKYPWEKGGAWNKRMLKAGNADWLSLTGAGQTIGILSFDNYVASDIADYLALIGEPALASQVSRVAVNGGVLPGATQYEVLLDIVTALGIAPGADVVVYDAPFTGGGTSFQTVLNAMIGGGVTIISNSWAYCENQTTLADVQSIDALFATAAASGISAFNASGDHGPTCLNGSPNTAHVPASSPNATAVGGSSVALALGRVPGTETWWDGTADVQPTGQGGFGVSTFFARPSYQDGWTASAKRSVPDLVANADPKQGRMICQASDGGCPSGKVYGGTSMAAPTWAGFAAILNEGLGANVGNLNAAIYPHGASVAFRNAGSLGSDFAHVGLGGVNLNQLLLLLKGTPAGAASAAVSTVIHRTTLENGIEHPPHPETPADGATQAVIVVQVRDANGNPLGGKTVSLAANAGSSAIVAPASQVTSLAHLAAVFTVTDLATEIVTLTATDVTDGIALDQTVEVTFGVPPATGASIFAAPNSVLNDGVATTTITVTLVDALARPTPGKLVTLSQGPGHSIVTGPNPSVTDATGKIEFVATDTHAETVTYTAIDVTDGDLDVPGSAVVDFTGQPTSSCVTVVPTAAPGYAITPWSTGYQSAAYFYSGINFGCAGASNPAFDADGNAYVSSHTDGKLYLLPPAGGIAGSGSELSTLGPTLNQPAFGKDGRLYVARGATGSGLFSGAIYELNPDTGAIVRTLASPVTCPQGIAVDPLSGDLFFNDGCFGAGTNDARIFRISDPAGAATLSPYATLPASPTGWMVFSPDGTLYAQSNYLDSVPKVQRIGGTDQPQPASVTQVPNLTSIYWLTIGETLPSGAAKSLIVLGASGLRLADITTDPPTFTELTNGGTASGVVGPDGCLYFSATDVIFRLTKSNGDCGFDASSATPSLALSPAIVTPDPLQGATRTFTASFANVAVPAGTPVSFLVRGANAQLKSATTDAGGTASVAYVGVHAGDDRVTAIASVGGTAFKSNTVDVHWGGGKHATFLTITRSPGGGSVGAATTLNGTLLDVSVEPAVPVVGETVHFTLGALSCDGVTGADGTASCAVVPTSSGPLPFAAQYDGSASYLPASASDTFLALAAPNPACFSGALPAGGMATACVAGALSGCQFASAAFVTSASVGTPPPAGVTLPFGLFQFVATGCGNSATLTLTYPNALPANATYWKFGPTTGQSAHWYSMPAQVSGNTLTVTIVDGGTGDSDLTANGSISDPGGAGVLAAAVADTALPVPTLDAWALVLLSALLMLAAARRRAR